MPLNYPVWLTPGAGTQRILCFVASCVHIAGVTELGGGDNTEPSVLWALEVRLVCLCPTGAASFILLCSFLPSAQAVKLSREH